ncbi:MAG: LamG domain-containing protein [Polyangiaceae bacterium]
MTRLASLGCRALCAPLSLLYACTPAAPDRGPTSLERRVDDSGVNKALLFNGMDQYVTTATAEFQDGLTPYALSTWFRLDGLTGQQAFITVRKDLDSGLGFGVIDGALSAWRVSAVRTLVAAPKAVTVDTWHHAAYVFDNATNQLFLDGALVASSTTVPDKRTPTSCWLGTRDGTSDLLHGSLDDVHVFKVARTAEEIMSEFTGPLSTDTPDMVMNLTFDETDGPIAYDHSSFENDGTLGDGIPERMPKRTSARKASN